MFASKRLPRWHAGRSFHISGTPRQIVRTQHDQHGPQARRVTNVNLGPVKAQSAPAYPLPSPNFRSVSLLARVLRNLFYASLFGLTGFALAWGVKTYRYLQIGQILDLPATRQRHKEWFDRSIDGSRLVQSLRRDGWVEEDPLKRERTLEDVALRKPATAQGQHMLNTKLVGDGHIATRHFRHPSEGMTVLVFVADFACESWPDTLHGGVATTVIQEALDTHLKHFPNYAPIRNRETIMNYRLPLRPNTIYSVFIRTDEVDYPFQSSDRPDKSFMSVGVNVLVNQMNLAPRFVEKYNEETQSTERVCKIHDAKKGVSAYVRGGSVLFLASKYYRDLAAENQEVIPALKEKLEAWKKAYKFGKSDRTR